MDPGQAGLIAQNLVAMVLGQLRELALMNLAHCL